MPKGDISDGYLPAGQAYDILLSLFQYNDPLITSDEIYSAADSQIRHAKGFAYHKAWRIAKWSIFFLRPPP
jgi:hypothetical protein